MPQPITPSYLHHSPGTGQGPAENHPPACLPPSSRLAPPFGGVVVGEEHPRSLGSRAEPREVTPFLNEIELPFSSSSQMSAALDQIRS